MIHLALLDDHPAVLAGLRRLIEHEPDLLIVGAAPTAPELARQLGEQRADVLILDHDLARSDGLAHCRRIKDRPDPPAVIIYSAFASQALALAARVAHADAVVDKAEPVPSLLAAIRSVAAGETVLPAIPREAYDDRHRPTRRRRPPRPGDAARRRVASGDRRGAAHRPSRDRLASPAHHRPPPARRDKPRDGQAAEVGADRVPELPSL